MADTFKGPPQKQGIIGRLALDRQLADYGFAIYFSFRGLSSESITIQGESSKGVLSDGPTIRYAKSLVAVDGNTIQNGDFLIRMDDLDQKWENLCFIKSGALDRLEIQLDSPFDYVEAPSRVITPGSDKDTMASVDGWGFGGWGLMHWGG